MATFSTACSSGDRKQLLRPSLSAFHSVTSTSESSLVMPISSSLGSSTSMRIATYSSLPSLGFIFAMAFPICLSQAQ